MSAAPPVLELSELKKHYPVRRGILRRKVGSVLAVMRSLRESGMTLIVVSHELGFARAAADRVVFMDHGLIVEQGPPAQIFESPGHERTRAFIGPEQLPLDEVAGDGGAVEGKERPGRAG